jgi:hypothetical protein
MNTQASLDSLVVNTPVSQYFQAYFSHRSLAYLVYLHFQVLLQTNLGRPSCGEYTEESITNSNNTANIQKKFELLSMHVYRDQEKMFDEKNKRDKKNCVTDPLFATLQSGAS